MSGEHAEWEAFDREAAAILREHLDELAIEPQGPAYDGAMARLRRDLGAAGEEAAYFRAANGWTGELPESNQLWFDAAVSTMAPPEDPGTSAEEQAYVGALQHADWLGMVLGLVRRGVGAELDAQTVQRDIDDLEEVEGEIEDPEGHLMVMSQAVEVLAPLWQFLGILDDGRRLTALGRWGLPIALLHTWDPLLGDSETAGDRLDPDVEAAALAILAEAPRSWPDLRTALARSGTIVGAEPLRRGLIAHRDVWAFDDETVGHVPTLAADVVVTHVLDEPELELGMLELGCDLDVWMMLADDEGCPLGDGGRLVVRYRDQGYQVPGEGPCGLEGPEGWLGGFKAGDLVALRYVDGALRLEPADPTVFDDEAYADELRAVASTIEEAVAFDEEHGDPTAPGAGGAEIVYRMRRARPDSLRRPLPPLGGLAEAFGYEVHHGYVCRPGASWSDPPPEWFSLGQKEAWRRWHEVTAQWRSSGEIPEDELRALARDLAEQHLLGFVSPDVIADPGLDDLLVEMEGALDGPLLAVPRLLRASAAEARGDVTTYRALLEAARDADPHNEEALADLADLHAIAGEAREADRLYRAAGLDASADEITVLQPFLQPPADGPGRNRPCPCGSGKKYKLCHGRTAFHPLEQRASWLWRKLCMFAQRSPQRADMLAWGALVAGSEPDSHDAVRQALQNPLVQDFAIVDGGLLDRFLAVMGGLLPADERGLAESWVGRPMRLMEVRRVLPMRGVVAVDLLTEEELEITDRRLSREIDVRDILLGRPLDDGSGTLRLQSPPSSIPRMMRARLLALLRDGAPAEQLAAALAPRRPAVQTTEGQEFVLCAARYDVPDLDETWRALAERFGASPDDDALHLLSAHSTILGTVRRDRQRLVLETNAVERLRTLQAELAEVDPGARLVDESTRPLDLDNLPEPGGPVSSERPELSADELDDIRRMLEDRWLEESVPALGGETPREAADSSRRGDLAALLDDIEWQQRRTSSPLDMDIERLRRELGLVD